MQSIYRISRRVAAMLLLILLTHRVASVSVASPVQPSPSPAKEASVEYVLPYPGILPDHPLYKLKQIRDALLFFLYRDPTKKSQLHLLLADKKLVMGSMLWEKNKREMSTATLEDAEKHLIAAADTLFRMSQEADLPPGMADKIELSSKKHEEVIQSLLSMAIDETERMGIQEVLGITHQAMQKISAIKSFSSSTENFLLSLYGKTYQT